MLKKDKPGEVAVVHWRSEPDRRSDLCPGQEDPSHRTRGSLATAGAIVEGARTAAIATDAQNRIVSCNRRAQELLRCDPGCCPPGATLYSRLQARDPFGNRLFDRHVTFLDALSRGEGVRSFELQLRRPTGGSAWVSASVVIVVGADGHAEGFVYFLEPVESRRERSKGADRPAADPAAAGERRPWAPRADDSPLTPRQKKILRLLADGFSDGEIATSLYISIHTVRNHLRAILSALGVRNRAHAVARAFRDRLL